MSEDSYNRVYSAPDRRMPLGSFLVLLGGLAPFGMALATVLGLGLSGGLSQPAAWIGATILVAIPILGIGSLLGRSVSAYALATWLWSSALLIGMPYYLPGARGPAMTNGLAVVTKPWPKELVLGAEVVAEATERLLGGPEAPPATPWTVWKSEGEKKPEAQATATPENAEAAFDGAAEKDEQALIVLPFVGEQPSMQVQIGFLTPQGVVDLPMLFDTGATLTTLSHAALEQIGVQVPSDAPRAQLTTANGVIDTPVVLLDGVQLDGLVLERVSVAACDSCAQGEVEGLLGLNITGRFDLTLRPEEREVALRALDSGANQHLDLAHWLDITSTATAWRSGRIEVEVRVVNRADVHVSEAVVEVACAGRSFAVSIDTIPGRGEERQTVGLPRGTDCATYQVMLRSARW